jgi:hypothetical protein
MQVSTNSFVGAVSLSNPELCPLRYLSKKAREDEEKVLRRAAELREQHEKNAFDEESAYSLPFEELERRARGW